MPLRSTLIRSAVLSVSFAVLVTGWAGTKGSSRAAPPTTPIHTHPLSHQLRGIPLYPGATLDGPATQGLIRQQDRWPALSGWTGRAYQVDATPKQVVTWYRHHLLGWKVRPRSAAQPNYDRYAKGNLVLSVMVDHLTSGPRPKAAKSLLQLQLGPNRRGA